MCLDRKAKILIKKDEDGYIGWKIFVRYNGWRSPIFNRGHEWKMNEWVVDKNAGRIKYSKRTLGLSRKYKPGFHCYTSNGDADIVALSWEMGSPYSLYAVMEIRARDIVATGLQNGADVFVARSVMVIEDNTLSGGE